MCLIAFAYRQHKDYPLILIANRDEFYARPSSSLGFWEDQPDILAGRDLEQMGTWLGVNRRGRITALTNFRDGRAKTEGKKSRGELTRQILESSQPIESQLKALSSVTEEYSGFNLLAGDGTGIYYLNHLDQAPTRLERGIYGLSNAVLDSPWPKTNHLKEKLQHTLDHNPDRIDAASLTELLLDREETEDHLLPDTGISHEWEKHLSACFIGIPGYGTRASSVILQRNDGMTTFRETSFDQNGQFKTTEYTIQCKPIK